jgi:hypothetical protein
MSRQLTREGAAKQIEDGVLVIGEKQNRWFLVETGTGRLGVTTAKSGRCLRISSI